MDVVPSSRSLILRASHILVIRVEAAKEQPWTPRAEGSGEERTVELTLRLEEVVKGAVAEPAGSDVTVRAKQVRVGFAWGPMPGIWSNAPIEPGTRLVAFSRIDGDGAAAALTDPGGLLLLSTEEALVDVHLAAQIAAQQLDLAGATALAKGQAAAVNHLFADFLWARYEAVAMGDVQQFEHVARFLEEPALGGLARNTLLMALSTAVHAPEPPAYKQIDRLAIAMFHLLAMPQAADLHDNLVGTHLPNLLELDDEHPRPASEVFADHPGEKAAALRALQTYKGAQSTLALTTWLTR